MTIDATTAAADLRAALTGRVLTAADPEYDLARVIVLGGADPHPAVIAFVADTADVQHAVRIGRRHGLEIAVRSGGHSGAAFGSVDDGLVIDVRDLSSIDIDPVARTAWAGSGVDARAYTEAAQAHGLATGFGDTGSVGLGGLITGGGIGYLVRKHGLTIDSLLAAEVVTADGEVHLVDADHEPDLFWAIRGGGGNVGIATRFQLRLVELPQITGGMLILPATPATVVGFLDAAAAAPDELSTIANVMPCPPMPFIPEAVHGQVVILGMLCYAGDAEAGAAAIAPFRALADPLADMVQATTYGTMFPPDDSDYHPLAVARTAWLDRIDEPAATTLLRHLAESDAPMRVAQLRVMGGAASRVPNAATAYAHRDEQPMVNVAAFYEGDADRPAKEAWVTATLADLPVRSGGYVNFLGDEGEEGVRRAYPGPTYDRLAAIKRRYDPDNVFHRNQNVPPAAA